MVGVVVVNAAKAEVVAEVVEVVNVEVVVVAADPWLD